MFKNIILVPVSSSEKLVFLEQSRMKMNINMSTFFKMLFSSPSISHIYFFIHLYNFVILNIKH